MEKRGEAPVCRISNTFPSNCQAQILHIKLLACKSALRTCIVYIIQNLEFCLITFLGKFDLKIKCAWTFWKKKEKKKDGE
jgi:hypothetical protein